MQLLLDKNNLPSSTTVGPNLEKHLAQYYSNGHSLPYHQGGNSYEDQDYYASNSQYIPPVRNAVYPSSSMTQRTDLFDPVLEGDEDKESMESIEREQIDASGAQEEGILPMLWRTAKDDLKLVGNVLRFALAK